MHHSVFSNRLATSSIDFKSVITASQAISRETKQEAIFERLMQVLLENAGAQNSYYLIEKKGHYMILAECHSDRESTFVLKERQAGSDCVPVKILNYVARTKESVVLEHAVTSENYGNDAYILAQGSKSVNVSAGY